MTRLIDLSGDSRFNVQIAGRGKRGKYGNKKTQVDGITFASRKEAERYRELKLLQMGKAICDLKLQKKYVLVPAVRENGKVVQRAINYYADFVYTDAKTGQEIVEDVKGCKTQVYLMKKKMMLEKYGIQIREI